MLFIVPIKYHICCWMMALRRTFLLLLLMLLHFGVICKMQFQLWDGSSPCSYFEMSLEAVCYLRTAAGLDVFHVLHEA